MHRGHVAIRCKWLRHGACVLMESLARCWKANPIRPADFAFNRSLARSPARTHTDCYANFLDKFTIQPSGVQNKAIALNVTVPYNNILNHRNARDYCNCGKSM